MDESTAELVLQMREALLWIAGRRTGGMIQIRAQEGLAAADQWLAQPRGPLADEQIIALAPPEIPERYDNDLVYFARALERAHGISWQAGEESC